MIEATTPTTDHHAYVEGVQTRTGRDGRVYRLCRVCGDRANARPHRGFRTTPATVRERAGHHDFQEGGPPHEDARGRVSATCKVCGRLKRATEHGGPDLRVVTTEADASQARRRPTAGLEAAPPPPQPAVKRFQRPERIGAEVLAVAMALDVALALPADRMSWKLRLKMVGLRDAIPVAPIPSLTEATEPVEDAPSDTLAESMPDLAPRVRPSAPVAVQQTILRGIRNDRARELVKRAIRSGFEASKTGGGHIALHRGTSMVIVSTTSNDGRLGHGWANLRQQAKRAGIDVTGL